MTRTINPAVIGSLVRQARTTAGLSQTELGHRIGASRFWVAQLEKGKPGAELGLAIKALEAVGPIGSDRTESRTEKDGTAYACSAVGRLAYGRAKRAHTSHQPHDAGDGSSIGHRRMADGVRSARLAQQVIGDGRA